MDAVSSDKLILFVEKEADCALINHAKIPKQCLQLDPCVNKTDEQLQVDLDTENKNGSECKNDSCFYCENSRLSASSDTQCASHAQGEVGRPDTMNLADNMHLLMHMHSRLQNRLLTAVVSQRGASSPQHLTTELVSPVCQSNTAETQTTYVPEKTVHKCPQCGKLLVSKRNLKYHMKLHTGDMDYKCYICSKGFTHKNKLVIHIKLHTGQKDFVCSVCNKAFVQKCDLLRHTKLHTGQKDFVCTICNKGFIQRSDLLKHSKLHTGQKDFVCSVCSKAFIQKSDLLRHNKIHWPDGCPG